MSDETYWLGLDDGTLGTLGSIAVRLSIFGLEYASVRDVAFS